jgi:hypothetical protein
MAKKKGVGPVIHGETANAWERRTRRQLEAKPPQGFGMKAAAIAYIEGELEKDGRGLAPEPSPPSILTDKFFTVVIVNNKPTQVELSALPEGKVGQRYLVQLLTKDGYAPVAFGPAIENKEPVALPAGITLDRHGVIDGAFVEDGEQVIRVRGTDAFDQFVETSFTVFVAPADVEETEEEETEEEIEQPGFNMPVGGLLAVVTPETLAGLPVAPAPKSSPPQGDEQSVGETPPAPADEKIKASTEDASDADIKETPPRLSEVEQPADDAEKKEVITEDEIPE